MSNKNEYKQRFSLTILFSFIVFANLLLSTLLTVTVLLVLLNKNFISYPSNAPKFLVFAICMAVISLVIGFLIAMFVGRLPLKPVNRLITQMNRLASGDFKARIKFGRPIVKHPVFIEVADSFNKMAQELESTEMLRSDFVNNFSHEFKTPIVSIAGFAKLLKKGNLSEEQKQEYITIIEEESMRLADMATNVLALTKVENQTILTDVTEFNLSEQMRSSILLLEHKWTKSELELDLGFAEHKVKANEELLKQVWINLLDNAVKFSPKGGKLSVGIRETEGFTAVAITNSGEEISEEQKSKIFNKFYQGDPSHSGVGNGIGLAVVKHIVGLHKGRVEVESLNGKNTFTVFLPKEPVDEAV